MRHALLSVLCMLAILTAGCATGPKSPFDVEPEIRVLIIETLEEVSVTPKAEYRAWTGAAGAFPTDEILAADAVYTLRAEQGRVILALGEEELINAPTIRIASEEPGGLFHFEGVPYGVGWWWESLENRSYPGHFLVKVNAQGLLDVIVTLPVEEYLRGVVPQEIGPESPMEALKAQAVAARTETIVALLTRKYAGDGYDICADVMCQAYSGTARYSDATARAIEETRGMVLVHGGEPFSAYYASNCGGHSENIENVWPERSGPQPYYAGVPDAIEPVTVDLQTDEAVRAWLDVSPPVFCNPEYSPHVPEWAQRNFRWVREFTAEEMAEHVARTQDIGRVRRIDAVSRGVSGRMIEARIVGETGEFTIGPELPIRQVWDPPLRSATFVVDTEGPVDLPDKFVVRGAGWGHGVGMCQTGAIARANSGYEFGQILRHYYQGSNLRTMY